MKSRVVGATVWQVTLRDYWKQEFNYRGLGRSAADAAHKAVRKCRRDGHTRPKAINVAMVGVLHFG